MRTEAPPLPYVKELPNGGLVGALSKSRADRLIADLEERTAGSVRKATTFRPDNPRRVVTGSRPSYPTRTADAARLDAYYRAVEAVRVEFVKAEGREPTEDDVNWTTAVDELYDSFFPKTGKWEPAPVKKARAGGLVSSAMQKASAPGTGGRAGERVVMRGRSTEDAGGPSYGQALEAVTKAFVDAEGRDPGPNDANFVSAVGDLYMSYFGGN